MRKPTKTELFYKELHKIVYKNVTWNLNDMKDIKDKVENFINTQKYLKKPYSKYSIDLLHFMIGERFLDLIEENLLQLKQEKIIYPFTYYNYETFVIQKINEIGLFLLNNCSPDIITGKILKLKNKQIKNIYYDLDEETNKQRKFLELLKLKYSLNNLNSNNIHIKNAILNIEKELENI